MIHYMFVFISVFFLNKAFNENVLFQKYRNFLLDIGYFVDGEKLMYDKKNIEKIVKAKEYKDDLKKIIDCFEQMSGRFNIYHI